MNRYSVISFLVLLFAISVFAADHVVPKPASADLPTYPDLARRAHVTGSVRLWFVLNEKGEVSDAGAISGHPLLRDAALANLKTWKFASESTAPKVRYETEFVYALDVQQKPGEPKLVVSIVDSRRVQILSELYVEPIE